MTQTLYNGVKLLGDGPDIDNIEKIDLGALPMIHRMTQTGLQVDLNHFAKMEIELERDMDEMTEKVHALTGYHINVDSGDQVSDLLFKKLGLKQIRPSFTKGGVNKEARESVENEVLVAIQHDHEVVPVILKYKEYSKLKGTYVAPMPKLAKRTKFGQWRIYPNLGTTRVPSGRLNCKEPNLLAMPNRSKRGRQVCEGFICDTGYVYLSVDESQIEPRLAAHLSQDKNLMNIYLHDEDIYSDFAIAAFKLVDNRYECHGFGAETRAKDGTRILCDNSEHKGHGWHYPSVHKKDHRFPAKTCILASIYDVTGKGLLEQMPIICANCHLEATIHTCKHFKSYWTEQMCWDLINAFYGRYYGVMVDRKKNHRIAQRYGYVWDMWGRILHVPAVRSIHPWIVSSALREVGNFPYQSGAQGTIKLTMAQVEDEFVASGMYEICEAVLQIHDELLFVCREEDAEEIGAHVAGVFEKCVELSIPIKAGVAKAHNWGSMPK